MWDQGNKRTGPYLRGHTDWSMIELGLDLLGRNGVMPDKVNIGFGFYGRSFTMRDPDASSPTASVRSPTAASPARARGRREC